MIILLVWSLGGCAAEEGGASEEYDKPTFYLNGLPELEPFNLVPEIKNRYGKSAYSDVLIAAGDYGKLFPYEGKYIGSGFWGSIRYGLVDARGRIVVDPIYVNAYYLGEDQSCLCLVYPDEGMLIAGADGSWVREDLTGQWAQLYEDRIVINGYETAGDYDNPIYSIYDTEGRLIAKGPGYLGGFSEGLGIINHFDRDGRILYRYIDKDGKVAIPGPFFDANAFRNGKAIVSADIGQDGVLLYGVIGYSGEFLIPPERDYDDLRNIYEEGQIHVFYESSPDWYSYYGVKGKNGEIIVPAEYEWIGLLDAESNTAIAQKSNREYYIVDLPEGSIRRIEGDPISVTFAGDGWRRIEYDEPANLLILEKDGAEYKFEYPQGSRLECFFIEGELFALVYFDMDDLGYTTSSRTDIFDAGLGKVVKSLPDRIYSYTINDRLYYFNRPGTVRAYVLGKNFEPHFADDVFAGSGGLISIYHIADGVYQVKTIFFTGLIKENGQWLIRIKLEGKD